MCNTESFQETNLQNATYHGTSGTWHLGNEGRPEMATDQLDTYMAKSTRTQHMGGGITKIVVVYSNSRSHINKRAIGDYLTSSFRQLWYLYEDGYNVTLSDGMRPKRKHLDMDTDPHCCDPPY
jgi:hypothetical protein